MKRSEAERQQLAITLPRDFDMENSVNSDKPSTSFLFLKFGIFDFCYINCFFLLHKLYKTLNYLIWRIRISKNICKKYILLPNLYIFLAKKPI